MEKRARIAYEGIELTNAEIARRQAVISENSLAYLKDWSGGVVDPRLEPYQEPAFEALLRFTHENGEAILTDEDVLCIQSGYLDEPTSFGKTAVIARFLEAVKVGTLPTPDSRVPIRALIGTLSQYAVKQTASLQDMSRGLKKFLPNANVTANFADHPDLSGDACLLTYRALLLLARAKKLNNLPFDIGIGDEAHNLLGRETSKIWRAFAATRRTIGLTATPEYGPHKKLDMLFDKCIHRSDLRSLVVAGKLSGVQVLGFGTGAQIEAKGGVVDFSEASLEPLLRNTRRNQAICNITAALVAEGRRVIVNALPGEGLFHAQLIAGALHDREYVDSSGIKRKIRAAAIGTHIRSKQCDEILEAFRAGGYDVIVQVDKINQSFDCPDVSAIVNAAPTLSQVRSTQRIGRVMRPNEEWPIKIIVEFIDDVEGSRMQHTAWHVLGEAEMKQGAVVASKELLDELNAQTKTPQAAKDQESQQSGSKAKRLTVPSVEDFDQLLQAMHQDYAVRLVDSLLLASNKGYGPPPKGWPELRRVVESKFSDRSLGLDGIRGLLERKGDDFCKLFSSSRGPTYFISPEAEEFLDGYEFPDVAPSDAWKTEREIAREHNLTRDVVRRCSKDMETREFLSRHINRVHAHFGPEQIATIVQRAKKLAEQETMAKTLIAATALASEPEVNWERASIHYFLVSHYGVEGVLLKSGQGPDGRYYTVEEADLVRRHRRHSFQVTQTELKKRQVVDLEAESGHTRDEVLAAASELGLMGHVKDGRYKDRDGAYHYTELAAAPVADKIVNHLHNPPPAQPKPAAASSATPPRPSVKKESLPDPADHTKAKEGGGELQDVSTGLRSLDSPCLPTIIPLLIRHAKLEASSFERRGGRYFATENAILDLADHIQTYPVATYEMKTPRSIAERLNVELDYVLTVASRAVANIGKEAGLYRGREDENGNAGILEVYYSHSLVVAIERYVIAQKQRTKKKQSRNPFG